MNDTSLGENGTKRRKVVTKAARQQAVVALQVAGLTQGQIAEKLGVSRRSIARDASDLKESATPVADILAEAQRKIRDIMPVQQRVEKYVEHAKGAKNEAVSLAALTRLDDIDGIVTEKELVRSKRNDPAPAQPMFMLPVGAQVNVSVTHVQAPEKCINMQVGPDNVAKSE